MFARQGVLMLLGLAVAGVALVLLGSRWHEFMSVDSTKSGNVLDNPRYKDYRFGPQAGPVIDAAYQPGAIPSGTIPAAMMHDHILARQMETLGRSLQFHPFLEGGDINAFLFAGHLEFMWAGDMPVIKAAANTSIVVTAQIKTAFASIVARNLLSMDQLKNRRIGYAPGSSGHHALLQGLALHNMSEKDVQLVQMPINQMIASIQNSSIDAFAAWEPTPTLAMEKIKDLTVPYRVLTQSYLYFSKSFADANPDLTRLLTAANLRAIRWMSKNTNNARQACQWHVTLAEQFLGQPAAFSISQCQSILQRDLLDPLPMAMFPLENLKRGGTITQQVEFLQKIGALKANVDPEKIASAFNPAIQQEIVRHMEIWKINEFDYQ